MQHAVAIESIKDVIKHANTFSDSLRDSVLESSRVAKWPSNDPLDVESGLAIYTDFKMAPKEDNRPAKRTWGVVAVKDGQWAPIIEQIAHLNSLKEECREKIGLLKGELGRFKFKKHFWRSPELQAALTTANISHEIALTALYRKVQCITEPVSLVRFHASYKNTKSTRIPYGLVRTNLQAYLSRAQDSETKSLIEQDLERLSALDKSVNYLLVESVSPCPHVNVTYKNGVRESYYAAMPLLVKESDIAGAGIHFPEHEIGETSPISRVSRNDQTARRHVGIYSMPIFLPAE